MLISNAVYDANLYEFKNHSHHMPQPISPRMSLYVASVPHQARVPQALFAFLPGDVHQSNEGCSAVSMDTQTIRLW